MSFFSDSAILQKEEKALTIRVSATLCLTWWSVILSEKFVMEDDPMEEQARTELQLSEEHLQEITGGCLRCTADRIAITNLTDAAHYSDGIAAQALQAMRDGKTVAEIEQHGSVYREHSGLAQGYRQRAATLQQGLDARGHQYCPPIRLTR